MLKHGLSEAGRDRTGLTSTSTFEAAMSLPGWGQDQAGLAVIVSLPEATGSFKRD